MGLGVCLPDRGVLLWSLAVFPGGASYSSWQCIWGRREDREAAPLCVSQDELKAHSSVQCLLPSEGGEAGDDPRPPE